MPLIRYDTGDAGIWKEAPECGWQTRVLPYIQGSSNDVFYDTKGKIQPVSKICVSMWQYDRLAQFQITQEGPKQYTFKLNGPQGVYDEAIFVGLVKESFGEDAEVTIEYVNEIPVLQSGKRKIAVNHYKKAES